MLFMNFTKRYFSKHLLYKRITGSDKVQNHRLRPIGEEKTPQTLDLLPSSPPPLGLEIRPPPLIPPTQVHLLPRTQGLNSICVLL